MALNPDDRVAVFATMAEVVGRTWQLKGPFLVMAFLIALPGAIAMALGFFDPLGEFMAVSAANGYEATFDQYPFGTLLITWAAGAGALIIFAIFWYRYLLLGREGALKFGIAAFNSMFWRMAGYGVVVMLATLAALILSFIASVAFATGLALVIAQQSQEFIFGLGFVAGLVAYIPPIALMVRFSLTFAAIAAGKRLPLGESWSLTGGTTWRIFSALMLLLLPVGLLTYAINFGVHFALGVNMLDPQSAVAVYDYWWISFALSPLMVLPMALAFGVVAVTYRDLTGTGAVELPAGASLA